MRMRTRIRNTDHDQSPLCVPQSVPPPLSPQIVAVISRITPTRSDSPPLATPTASALHHQPAGVHEKIRASAASGGTGALKRGCCCCSGRRRVGVGR